MFCAPRAFCATANLSAQCQVDDTRLYDTLKTFLAGQSPNAAGGFSIPALRAKASALFGAAVQLAGAIDPKKHDLSGLSVADVPEFAALDATVSRFLATLLPIGQLDAAVPEVRHALVAIHALAQAAAIKLSEPFVLKSPIAHEKTLRAAREIVGTVKHLMEGDYDFLDPILGVRPDVFYGVCGCLCFVGHRLAGCPPRPSCSARSAASRVRGRSPAARRLGESSASSCTP